MPQSLFEEADRIYKAVTSDDSAKKKQEERSRKYHIKPHEGGNVTKPSKYKNLSDSQFADPVNYAYPIDEAHVLAAYKYFSKPENRAVYSSSEAKIVADRIIAALPEKNKEEAKRHLKKSTEEGESIVADNNEPIKDEQEEEVKDKTPEAVEKSGKACKDAEGKDGEEKDKDKDKDKNKESESEDEDEKDKDKDKDKDKAEKTKKSETVNLTAEDFERTIGSVIKAFEANTAKLDELSKAIVALQTPAKQEPVPAPKEAPVEKEFNVEEFKKSIIAELEDRLVPGHPVPTVKEEAVEKAVVSKAEKVEAKVGESAEVIHKTATPETIEKSTESEEEEEEVNTIYDHANEFHNMIMKHVRQMSPDDQDTVRALEWKLKHYALADGEDELVGDYISRYSN